MDLSLESLRLAVVSRRGQGGETLDTSPIGALSVTCHVLLVAPMGTDQFHTYFSAYALTANTQESHGWRASELRAVLGTVGNSQLLIENEDFEVPWSNRVCAHQG